jgi:hypothetical protein
MSAWVGPEEEDDDEEDNIFLRNVGKLQKATLNNILKGTPQL